MKLTPSQLVSLITGFDDVRPTFLAAMDQIVVEMRPKIVGPDRITESLISCAVAFSNFDLVRAQIMEADPSLLAELDDSQIAEAHLAAVAYLFSLALHELITSPAPPSLTPAPTEGAE